MVGDSEQLVEHGRSVLERASEALAEAAAQLGDDFVRAAEWVARAPAKIVVTGMGKANFVAQKLSATLASTGRPSLFVHPADALHGDLGRLTAGDVLVALSHSGETEEILRFVVSARAHDVEVLAVTATAQSALGCEADLVLPMGRWEEAGSGLAPTTSTSVMLALTDALAMSAWRLSGVSPEAFARLHPAGALGQKLTTVSEAMRGPDMLPQLNPDALVSDALTVMTTTPGRPGAAVVVGADGCLAGIFTDGDFRRLSRQEGLALDAPVAQHMNVAPKTVGPRDSVATAVEVLRTHGVDQVVVVDERRVVVGLLDVQDLLRRGWLS